MNGNDALSAVTELAASQHGAFNRKQAASKSITARQLRAAVSKGRLWKPLSDVFVFASHRRTFRQRCAIASLAGGVISHSTAAVLHNLDGFRAQGSPIEVCFERNHTRPLPNVIMHSWTNTRAGDITTVDGIQCTSIARTLFQLGLRHPRHAVEVALDSALRQGARAAWIEETASALVRPGPTGGRVLLDIMYDPSREGQLSESVLEHVIEAALAIPGLPPAVRQYEVSTARTSRRLDLAFPSVRLGIEGHSRRHHFGAIRQSADATRDIELAAEGWEVIYVTWALAHDLATLIPLIRKTYEHRALLFRQVG